MSRLSEDLKPILRTFLISLHHHLPGHPKLQIEILAMGLNDYNINQSIITVYPPYIDSSKATKESPPIQDGKPYIYKDDLICGKMQEKSKDKFQNANYAKAK